MSRLFTAVDVETSGLDPEQHQLIEVGMVIETSTGIEEMSFTLDFEYEMADPKALEVNGWGNREFGPTVDPSWAAGFIFDNTKGRHLVGKNPHFDAAFLAHFLLGGGIEPGWHHRLVDVGALAWGYYQANCRVNMRGNWPQPPNVEKVEELVGINRQTVVGEDGKDYHSALNDARWAYEVFREVVDR